MLSSLISLSLALATARALTPQNGDYPGTAYTCSDPGAQEVITRKATLLNCPVFTGMGVCSPRWSQMTSIAWAIAFQETSCKFQGDFGIGNGKSGSSAEISLFRLNWGMITAQCDGYKGQSADAWSSSGNNLHGTNVCNAAACLVQAFDNLGPDQFFAQHRGGVSNVGNSDNGYYKSVIMEFFVPWVTQGGCSASATQGQPGGTGTQVNPAQASNSASSQQYGSNSWNNGQNQNNQQYDAQGNPIYSRRVRKRQGGPPPNMTNGMAIWYQMGSQ